MISLIRLFLLFSFTFIQAEQSHSDTAPSELERAASQAPPELEQFYGEFFKMLLMLGILLGFLILIMWLVKKFLNNRFDQISKGSSIQIIERRFLSPKTTLYILDIAGRKVVIAESNNGVSNLGEYHESTAEY